MAIPPNKNNIQLKLIPNKTDNLLKIYCLSNVIPPLPSQLGIIIYIPIQVRPVNNIVQYFLLFISFNTLVLLLTPLNSIYSLTKIPKHKNAYVKKAVSLIKQNMNPTTVSHIQYFFSINQNKIGNKHKTQ